MDSLKEQIERRREQFRVFNEWKEANPRYYSPEDALHYVSCLYEMLPPESRQRDDDPQREGIIRMHRILAMLSVNNEE